MMSAWREILGARDTAAGASGTERTQRTETRSPEDCVNSGASVPSVLPRDGDSPARSGPEASPASTDAPWEDGCEAHGVAAVDVARRWQAACGGLCEQCRTAVPVSGELRDYREVTACPCCGGPALLARLTCSRCDGSAP